ncbi:PREDICTED: uncharacterized protein LOC105148504 [Acromyrmex echinatior]|uniref:uncharacterized protein LOC105148504 n=1 Tax=Acromyrmex echinatior TaxID=103372 RepID=UPI000580F82F|nr:PREDICTED: uncharacterized protein LOC105148504 [Acromyrmex echinatior]
MDSYQIFVQTFKQAVSTRNFTDLPNIFRSGHTSLAIVSLEHRELIVCSIFDKNNGLLYFLNYELPHRIQNKHVDDTLTEAFNFLTFFINNFYTTPCFTQYIHEIKNVCQLGLKVKLHCFTKKAAHNAFIKLIELFKDHDLKFDETVRNYCRAFHNYDKKV